VDPEVEHVVQVEVPRSGLMLPPWTVPTSLRVRSPSSSTPAFNHFWMSRTTRRWPTRCSTNLTSHPCSRVSKKLWMSASSTQFTFFVRSPVDSASKASCGLRPGRNP
jgi:hypothetical protein